ncbi:RidA family protein [Orientia tsutsugamushi]|uniref:RidA family protein n=1 Tax=Orientia tsutsugamushi TaxID=784 RepID=UPI00315CF630
MTRQETKILGTYLKYQLSHGFIFFSGNLSFNDSGKLITGKASNLNLTQVLLSAQLAAENLLKNIIEASNKEQVTINSCVKLTIFINSDSNFTDHSLIGDKVSNLILSKYKNLYHARTTV